jgi:hypothetical protein
MANVPAPPRPAHRIAFALVAALSVLAALLLLGVSTARAARAGGWSRPFTLAGPYRDDILPARIAFSPAGEAAVAFGVVNEDAPQVSAAFLTTRSPDGRLAKPRRVPRAQQILDLAYAGAALQLLAGNSSARFSCCSGARTVTFAGGRFGGARLLIGGLDGAALGNLVTLPAGRMLAAIATGGGVWVAQSSGGGRFGRAHRLTSRSASPQVLEAAAQANGRSAVAWAQPTGSLPNAPASAVFLASGSAQRAPGSGRLVVTAPAGHTIDELDLAAASRAPTAAWIDSWYDSGGNYRSQAVVADLAGRVRARTFSIPGQVAAGVTLAANVRGEQVVAWKTCDVFASCSVRAASRGAGGRFGTPQRLGTIDASQAPAAAVAPDGKALVGWISGGHVLFAGRPSAGGRFGSPTTVSSTTQGYDLTVAFGPASHALAAWTEGTLAPRVVGAFHP